jgi:hypothetical protein
LESLRAIEPRQAVLDEHRDLELGIGVRDDSVLDLLCPLASLFIAINTSTRHLHMGSVYSLPFFPNNHKG